MAYIKELPKLVGSQVQVKEPAQVMKPDHHADRVQRAMSRSTLHGADHLLEESGIGKVNPNTK